MLIGDLGAKIRKGRPEGRPVHLYLAGTQQSGLSSRISAQYSLAATSGASSSLSLPVSRHSEHAQNQRSIVGNVSPLKTF